MELGCIILNHSILVILNHRTTWYVQLGLFNNLLFYSNGSVVFRNNLYEYSIPIANGGTSIATIGSEGTAIFSNGTQHAPTGDIIASIVNMIIVVIIYIRFFQNLSKLSQNRLFGFFGYML